MATSIRTGRRSSAQWPHVARQCRSGPLGSEVTPQRACPEPPEQNAAPLSRVFHHITLFNCPLVQVPSCWRCYCCTLIFPFIICLPQQNINPEGHLLLHPRRREQCMGPGRCSENKSVRWTGEWMDSWIKGGLNPRLIRRAMSGPTTPSSTSPFPAPTPTLAPHQVASPHSCNL